MAQRQPKTEKAFGNGREKGGAQGSGSKLHQERKVQDQTLHKIAQENEKVAAQRAAAEHAVSSAAAEQQLAAKVAAADARQTKLVEEREARLKAAVASGKFKWTAEDDESGDAQEPAAAAGSSGTNAGPKRSKVVDDDGWEVVQPKKR